MPVVYFITDPLRAESVENGFGSRVNKVGADQGRMGFVNGDTLEYEMTRAGLLLVANPTIMGDTEILIWQDTLSTQSNWEAGVTGNHANATKYKDNLYTYIMGQEDPFDKPTHVLLGLAKMFDVAGYVPRRKLNLMMIIDHPILQSTNNVAQIDTLLAHAKEQGWRFNTQTMSWSGDPEGSSGYDSTAGIRITDNKERFLAVMHEHNLQMILGADELNIDGSDSALVAGQWNFLTRRLADTLRVNMAKGQYKLWGPPSGQYLKRYLHILAQDDFYGFRVVAGNPDSIGAEQTHNRIHLGPWNRKWPPALGLFVNKGGAKGGLMWMHQHREFPSSGSVTYADLATQGEGFSVSTPEGYNAAVVVNAVQMAIWPGAIMWHVQGNMSAAAPDLITSQFIRRLHYLTNRLSSILTVKPTVHFKEPRRHNASS